MPLSARATTVEFRSLLSPPLRVSLPFLRSFCRAQCSPNLRRGDRVSQCLTQRRSLVLFKTAKAKTVLGMHKLLPFDLYKIAPPSVSGHLVNVVKGECSIAKDISLQELYDNYVNPGQLLYLNHNIKKALAEDVDKLRTADEVLESCKTFGIYEAGSKPAWRSRSLKEPGALRVTPVSLPSPMEYFKLAMDRSYQFIEQGCPVEFSIRIKGAGMKKDERLKPEDVDAWMWMHNQFPHLRPDFILKSMPEGSRYVVDPVTDGRIVQFVIGSDVKGKQPQGLTARLMRVKEAVETSVAEGRQAQLPKRYRAALQSAGNEAYSEFTGLPIRKNAESKAVEESTDTNVDRSLRYLPEIPRGKRPRRDDKLSVQGNLLKAQPQKEYVRRKDKDGSQNRGETRGRVGRPQHRRAFEQMDENERPSRD